MNSLYSSKTLGLFVMDTKLETVAIKHLRTETQSINSFSNGLTNFFAEAFLSRTSAPFYHGEPNAYPLVMENEKAITDRLKDAWVYLRESSGTINASTSSNFKYLKAYYSPSVRVDLFVEVGMTDPARAAAIIKRVYPHGLYVPVVQRGNPRIEPGLGAALHGMQDPDDKVHVAALACRGAFQALFTWDRFNTMLVQGGWPWLRQYSRAYAKVIYTAMVLLFAGAENYVMNDMNSVRSRILLLAAKLVGNPIGGMSPWKIRHSSYLKGPKVVLPPVITVSASVSLVILSPGSLIPLHDLSCVLT